MSKADKQDFSVQTRNVYHHQHMRIAADPRAIERFLGMFSTEYFGVAPDFFKGKKVLDAGCGDTAKLLIALHRLGAGELHGLDLGQEFIPVAQASLERQGVSAAAVRLHSGSVTKLPFPDASFDFTCCHGVLLHLNDMDEVHASFAELARVTRPGGQLYTVFGVVGGVLEDAVYPALRRYYRENREFRELVDRIAPADFAGVIDFIAAEMERQTGERPQLDWLKELFDVDYCVTIQNVLQAPVRLRIEEETIRSMYATHRLTEVRRLKRYVKRKNIRRFFAPLHFAHDHPISRVLYGSGNMEFIGKKPAAD